MLKLLAALALCSIIVVAGCATSAPKVNAETNASVSAGAADASASGTVGR